MAQAAGTEEREGKQSLTYEQRQQRDQEHLDNPEVGDYWHEMFSPILVVVGVREDSIVFCQDTKEAGRDHWTWDPAKLTTLTREGFRGKLCYGGGGELANKAWASVVPRSHEWVRQAAIDAGWVDHAPPSRAKVVTWHPGGASKAEWPWKGDNSVTGDGKRYCYILQDGRYITGIMWREVWPKIVCYTDAEALEAPVEEFRKGVAQSG